TPGGCTLPPGLSGRRSQTPAAPFTRGSGLPKPPLALSIHSCLVTIRRCQFYARLDKIFLASVLRPWHFRTCPNQTRAARDARVPAHRQLRRLKLRPKSRETPLATHARCRMAEQLEKVVLDLFDRLPDPWKAVVFFVLVLSLVVLCIWKYASWRRERDL